MQKMALLIAVLSLGAGCASQGTGMASASGSSSSGDRYPWMNSESSDLNSMHRDDSGSVVIQTPSTSAQFDPAMSSSFSANATSQDLDLSADMDADRSIDSDLFSSDRESSLSADLHVDDSLDANVDLSAAGRPSGSESDSVFSADMDVDSDQSSQVSSADANTSDDLHSGSATWSNNDNLQTRADFEGAVATDDVDEALGRPASSETDSGASGSLQVGDTDVQLNADVDSSADLNVDSTTGVGSSADVDVDVQSDIDHPDTHHDIKADSSVRGGSDRVRNVPLRDMDEETPRNFTEEKEIKADSSIRGGSDRVRGVDLRHMDSESPRTYTDKNRIKADSSVRGGSAQARGTDRLWMSGNIPADVPAGRVTSNEPDWLHKMNPAQGTPAPTEAGRGSAFTGNVSGAALADRVKQSLVRENSGTGGMLSKEIARNIKVTNNNGTIVLSGSVPNERTSRLIEIRAGEVRGVKKVENRLTINSDSVPAVREDDPSLRIDVNQK